MSNTYVVHVIIRPASSEQRKEVVRILDDVWPAWRHLSDSISQHVEELKSKEGPGEVHLTEFYTSEQGYKDFCKTKAHDRMKERLEEVIDMKKQVEIKFPK